MTMAFSRTFIINGISAVPGFCCGQDVDKTDSDEVVLPEAA
jgi:hypothetical protein